MKTKEVVPYGVLVTKSGVRYYLLASKPCEPEDWMQYPQQKFLVSDYNPGIGQKRYLITTHPDILLYSNTKIKIEIMDDGEENG